MKTYAIDAYEEKRYLLAKLMTLTEVNDEFRRLEKQLCCCEDEDHLNCGCIVHGMRSRGMSKGSSINNFSDGGKTF